jgi:hypothetical protein
MHTKIDVLVGNGQPQEVIFLVLMQALPDSEIAALVRIAICPGRMQQVANFLQ